MRKEFGLTQKGLVRRLHRLGYRDITERRIADWKNKGLLPKFNRRGAGLGKGKGKAESTWTEERSIVERAVWIHRLLELYRSSESLHLPLWILGYEVPFGLVRAALLGPLEQIAEMFEVEALSKLEGVETYERKDGIIEDYIGDLSHDWVRKEKFAGLLGIPQEVIEATMNIFFNPDYDLKDLGFEDGFRQFAIWKQHINDEIVPAVSLGVDAGEDIPAPMRPEGVELVFTQPTFFQERLSVDALRDAVSVASEDDFLNVQEDLKVVRIVTGPIGEMFVTLMNHAKIRPLPTLHDVLPDVFRIANLLVLIDLSMRRHGFGPKLDHARVEVTRKFQEDFSEITEDALAHIGPEIGGAFRTVFKKLRKNWRTLLTEKAQISHVI